MSAFIHKRVFFGFDGRCYENPISVRGASVYDHEAKELELHYGVNTDAMISGQACTLGYTGSILVRTS